MKKRHLMVLLGALILAGCGPRTPVPQGKVVLKVNDYHVTRNEFEQGFAESMYADREDKVQAKADYLENLINQKLIVLDAQKKKLDRSQDFLRSIERFWEQSLMTVALGVKTREISKSVNVRETELKNFYDNMVKDGITTKSYQEVYPQIKWQAEKQMESRLLDEWMKGLRAQATINIDKSILKAE